MEKPTPSDIDKFMEIFDQLCQFEAHQRIRGQGCFLQEQLPFNEVIKVTSWLKQKASTSDKDVLDKLIVKYERKADILRVASASAHAKNDYISYSSLNEEAEIYENLIGELKAVGGLRKLKKK